MQRQRDPMADGELVDRRALCGRDPVVRYAGACRLGLHRWVMWVEENRKLRLVEPFLVGRRGGVQDLVRVVQEKAEVPQSSDARLRTDRGLARLDARKAERTLLGLAGAVVEVHLLVRAARHTHPPAAAPILVHQDDAVLAALVHRPGWA